MTSKERVKKVLDHKRPDKLPIGFFAIDCDTIESVIGRSTFLRAKAKSQLALWEGRRDEVIESWKTDFIEFYKKMDFIDIINLSPMTTAFAPPKDFIPEIPKKIDENTYQFKDGKVFKYSEITKDLTLVQNSEDMGFSFQEFEEKDYNFSWEEKEPDTSQFEVVNAILDAFKGDNKYIIGAGFQEGLFSPPNELEYYDHPEWVEKAAVACVQRANTIDEYLYRPEYDGIMWGADFAHNAGPFISPDMFQKIHASLYQ